MFDYSLIQKNWRIEAAAGYIEQGWQVIPIWGINTDKSCSCGNSNCSSPGKHPIGALAPNGLKNAANSISQMEAWFHVQPLMNLGITTGQQSGLVVLDVDPKHGGEASLEKLEAEYGLLPETPLVQTGSGGRHYYFLHPDEDVKNSVGKLGDGLDIRADGGYVVAPPSLHVCGGTYCWENCPEETPLAPLPDWIIAKIKQESVPVISQPTGRKVFVVGERNNSLMSIAGFLRKKGLDEEQIFDNLKNFNFYCCTKPLSDQELSSIAQSATRYPVTVNRKITFELTDLGNAERLVEQFGDRLKHNFDTKKMAELRW